MSGLEMIVVLAGLFLGYWIVAKFLLEKPASKMPSVSQPRDAGRSASVAQQVSSAAWHDVLNISPHASLDEIRSAYQTLMSQYHPDKVATLGVELRNLAEQKSREITQAYHEALHLHGADT